MHFNTKYHTSAHINIHKGTQQHATAFPPFFPWCTWALQSPAKPKLKTEKACLHALGERTLTNCSNIRQKYTGDATRKAKEQDTY